MDIYTLFDSQSQAMKRAVLKATIFKLSLSTSYRLMYEIGGRPGYNVETLKDVLLMITFVEETQKRTFLTILREELEKTNKMGITGPFGPRTVAIVNGPTGTYCP